MRLQPGIQFGSYELLALAGGSGDGTVWRARDVTTRRDVALRILPSPHPRNLHRYVDLVRDINALRSLSLPSLPIVYGLAAHHDMHALAVEWVDAFSLSQCLSTGAFELEQRLLIAAQVARTIAAAHERAVVHGNLTPTNIKVCADGTVKVLDLGIASLLEPESPHLSDRLPNRGGSPVAVLSGTAIYLSPEQLRGSRADAGADVWAFGCLLYELLAGRPAFGGTDVVDTIAPVLGFEPEWTLIPDSVPASIQRLVRDCLERDPAARQRGLADVHATIFDAIREDDSTAASELAGRNEDDLVENSLLDTIHRIRRPGRTTKAVEEYLRQASIDILRDAIRAGRAGPSTVDGAGKNPPFTPEVISLASTDPARMSIARAVKRLITYIRGRKPA